MLKRLFVGLLLGVVLGGLAAAAVVKGLGIVAFGGFLAYLAAAVTGAAVALFAGKPIWAKGAWIEVGLKAFFGSLLAAGAMFALRRWGAMSLDLSAFGAGSGALGTLPATSLPIIATVLSVFFELDNTEAPEEGATKGPAPKGRVAAAPANARVAAGKGAKTRVAEIDEEDDEAAASKKLRS